MDDYNTNGFPPKRGCMQRGIKLEALVSEALKKLNVPHECVGGTEFDEDQKIDLLVPAPWNDRPIEIQLTLRAGFVKKMRAFVEAAVRNLQDRGPRVYMEVLCWRGRDLSEVASRVAWAIKDIVRNFRNYDDLKMIGIQIHAGRPKRNSRMERFRLLDIVGISWFREMVERLIVEEERIRKEAIARAKEAFLAQRAATHPWWRAWADDTTDPRQNSRLALAPAHIRRHWTPIRQP